MRASPVTLTSSDGEWNTCDNASSTAATSTGAM
jgi:hypothetical protein